MALAAGLAAQPAAAEEFNTVTYQDVAAKARKLDGAPVAISTNYFLAWTGAWDSVVLREKEIWKKWLPEGSTVEWKRNLVGPPVITELLAGKQHLGYIGDNPAVVSTTKREIAEIDLVALNETSPGRMCGLIVVGKDAPAFADYKEALKWLNGKTVAAPKGSCAERLGQIVFKQSGTSVKWQQLAPEVTVTSLQAGKIDAAVIFEPYASKAVFDGIGRIAVSPGAFGESDANGVVMRRDFIEKNRAAAVAWLKANVEALLFIRDNPIETVEILKKELPEYTRENLWFSAYGALPPETGASPVVLKGSLALTGEGRDLIKRVHAYLYDAKIVQAAELAPNAVRDDLVSQAFSELGLDPSKALFELKGSHANPFKGDERVK
jgi:ABC-type nitrate/sulfonate/bicarbonate transport systems, periplasmic components